MFIREIWGKFTSSSFWNFEISLVSLGRFQNFKQVNSANLSQISLKYNTIWGNVSTDIKKESYSEPAYNKKLLKTKIKSYHDETTDFHDKEKTKADPDYTGLAIIRVDSVLKNDENFYPQVYLKECKYIGKEVIIEDPEISSHESDEE